MTSSLIHFLTYIILGFVLADNISSRKPAFLGLHLTNCSACAFPLRGLQRAPYILKIRCWLSMFFFVFDMKPLDFATLHKVMPYSVFQ